jgi:hypothetical protein
VLVVAALGVAAYLILPGLLGDKDDPRHPKAATAEAAVTGFFDALKVADTELALEYVQDKPTDTTFINDEFYQTMIDKYPLGELVIISSTPYGDPVEEYAISISVDVGGDTIYTDVWVAKVDDYYLLTQAITTVTLENTTAPSPLSLGGIPLEGLVSMQLLPGYYTVEMEEHDLLELTNPELEAVPNVSYYEDSFAFKFDLKQSIKTHISSAAQNVLDGCLAAKTLELTACSVGWSMSANSQIDPATIEWTVSSSNTGKQPKDATWKYDLSARVARADLNLKLYSSSDSWDGKSYSGYQTILSVEVGFANLNTLTVEFIPDPDNPG